MKKGLKFLTYILLTWLVSIGSCHKPDERASRNRAPIANAGSDQVITISPCSSKDGIAELDGSASYDPDADSISYIWKFLGGPQGSILRDFNLPKASVGNMTSGSYRFELTVRDAAGLSSTDEVFVRVTGVPQEYDLDMTFQSNYSFADNALQCYYYYYNCKNYDWTEIKGRANLPPIGDLNLYISEYADTATASYSHSANSISIFTGTGNKEFVNGICNVDFKKLIQQGGGPFTGTFVVTGGSARKCNDQILNNLSPLNLTGNLNVVTKIVDIRIQGKVYF